jgi:glycosyltransferase involved in cell wall biosynthesis
MNKVAIYLISDGIGGAEQVVRETIKGLSGYNSIFLIVNNEIASFYANLLPDSRCLNIGDIFLHSNKKFRIIRFLLNNRYYSFIPLIILSKSRKIINYLIDNDIEILHSHLDYALYSSLYIKKIKTNIKVFHTVHGAFGLIEDKLLKPLVPLSKIDFSNVDKLIFVSRYNYNLYKSKTIAINDFEIIYNGIDYAKNGVYCRPVKTNKIFEILYVGGSKYVKGFDILVETVDQLSKSNMAVSFHVVVLGHITDNYEFVTMIRQRGLERFFSLIGFVVPPLHLSYFESADMLLMPSRSEAFPIAVIEAISLDLPVIANNVGGIPEIIEHGLNGFLGNNIPQEYCEFIIYLMENYNSFLLKVKNYNMKIKPKFNAINMYKSLLKIYS